MVSVMTSLPSVSRSAVSSRLITELHSRGRRPAQRTLIPHSWNVGSWRDITSPVKFMRKATSDGERFQFSVEKAYAETVGMPSSMAPATTSIRARSPARWPSVRGSPR